jgi:hypothetical protein
LEHVCARIHDLWYIKQKKALAAKTYLPRLELILGNLPENNMAILRAEGLALFHELKGHTIAAINYRKREIQLMEKLHEDVEAGGYDKKMKASIMLGRGEQALEERGRILQALKRGGQLKSGPCLGITPLSQSGKLRADCACSYRRRKELSHHLRVVRSGLRPQRRGSVEAAHRRQANGKLAS